MIKELAKWPLVTACFPGDSLLIPCQGDNNQRDGINIVTDTALSRVMTFWYVATFPATESKFFFRGLSELK